MASLVLLTGTAKGQRFLLHRNPSVLGRDSACDLVIRETMVRHNTAAGWTDSISRRHAVIGYLDGRYYIEDGDGQGTKSRNGTFVNDQPVPFPGRVFLHDRDCIRICNFECTFHEEPEAGSSVEASISHDSTKEALEAQPAEKLRVILEISNSLSTTLDIDALLPRIGDHLLELFQQADRGFVILWDEASGRLVPPVFRARRPEQEADDRFSACIVRRCLGSVRAILSNDPIGQFPDSQSITGLPIRSLMCAPLWTQDGRALGAIQLDARGPKQAFTQDDLNLLLGVASQASVALCNAHLYRDSLIHQRRERDLEVAHQVQRALLPQRLPDVAGYQFHAYYESALEVGGDYYDFLPLPGGRLGVLLGDVAGKGVAAALVMAKFSVEARVCLLTEPEPAAAVSKLNGVMNRAGLTDSFVTLAAAVLDPAAHTATLVNAGHPSPLLARRATRAVEEATPADVTGPPLGVVDGHDYASRQIGLGEGDGLVLFSDGVTEAMDAAGHPFGAAGVRAVLGETAFSPWETGERLIGAVRRHAADCGQHDDIALVCFGRAGV